ncbi:MAG: hypothetical protein AB1644_04000 [Candidatus Zixiibacteriota bacterium]
MKLEIRQLIALVASALNATGAFLPMLGVPLLLDKNFFQLSKSGAWILIGLAGLSVLIVLLRKYRALYITGLASLGLVIYSLISIHERRSGYQQDLQQGMDKSPLQDIGVGFLKGVNIEYGWWVMVIGAVLLIAVPLVGSRLKWQRREHT